jgi:hypothetical protein
MLRLRANIPSTRRTESSFFREQIKCRNISISLHKAQGNENAMKFVTIIEVRRSSHNVISIPCYTSHTKRFFAEVPKYSLSKIRSIQTVK